MWVAHSKRMADGSTRTRATTVYAKGRLILAAFLLMHAYDLYQAHDYPQMALWLVIAIYLLLSGLRIIGATLGLKLWP